MPVRKRDRDRGTRVKRLLLIVSAFSIALVLAGSAFAGGSLTSGYGGKASGVQAEVKSAVKSAPAHAVAARTLPFTGVDLTLIVAGGFVLLLAGFGLRRAGRERS
jgi:hypothetical protein